MWQVLSDVRESKRQQSSSSACGDEKEKKEEKSCEFCALQRNSLQVPSHPIYEFCYLLSSAPLMLVGPTPRPHPELHAGRSSAQVQLPTLKQSPPGNLNSHPISYSQTARGVG